MELVQQLVSQLGISEPQAEGGAGLLLKAAQEKLGGEFSSISDGIPGVGDLLANAPSGDAGGGGVVGALASAFGGGEALGGLGSLAQLASGFSSLGLDSSMIGKFVPVVLAFVEGKLGAGARSLLEKVLT